MIQYTTIPAIRDAKLLKPPPEVGERWPVMLFSHGLGGSRNAYSHICGSLASHGIIVVAPDHRDGSAPISFIKDSPTSNLKAVDYQYYPHQSTPEVEKGRNEQLKIRCWELGMAHDALLKIDVGTSLTNTQATQGSDNLESFRSKLDVHRPGKISWAGHSFGATTITQFLKSVYHKGSILYPYCTKALSEQITPASPVSLLDLWAMPLTGSSTASLYNQPLPSNCGSPSSPPLVVLSEGFYKWTTNFQHTLHIATHSSSKTAAEAHIFYPVSAAHLSQSDFGILFPWLTKKALKTDDPDRTLRLNVRAVLESLRRNGISVADTSALDMEIGSNQDDNTQLNGATLGQDRLILTPNGNVRGWVAVDAKAECERLSLPGHMKGSAEGEPNSPDEAVMKYEINQ